MLSHGTDDVDVGLDVNQLMLETDLHSEQHRKIKRLQNEIQDLQNQLESIQLKVRYGMYDKTPIPNFDQFDHFEHVNRLLRIEVHLVLFLYGCLKFGFQGSYK